AGVALVSGRSPTYPGPRRGDARPRARLDEAKTKFRDIKTSGRGRAPGSQAGEGARARYLHRLLRVRAIIGACSGLSDESLAPLANRPMGQPWLSDLWPITRTTRSTQRARQRWQRSPRAGGGSSSKIGR